MKTLLWIIAIAVLQGIFAAAAKKAKANQAKASGAGAPGVAKPKGGPGAAPTPSRNIARNIARNSSGNTSRNLGTNIAATPDGSQVPPVARPGSRASATGKPVVLARGGEAARGAVATGVRGAPVGGARAAETLSGAADARFGAPTGKRGTTGSTPPSRSAGAFGGEGATKKVVQPASRPGTKPGTKPSTRPGTSPGTRPGTRPSTRSAASPVAGSVASSVARVQAAEARITGLPGIEIATPMIDAPRPTVGAGITGAMRSRDEVRRAVLLSEILGAPRAMRPYGA